MGAKPSNQSGFSLLELIIILSMLSVFMVLVMPKTEHFIPQTKTREHAATFSAFINRAREEAILRGEIVSLCKSADGVQCTSNGGYEQGFIIFTNPDSDLKVDASEEILHVYNRNLSPVTILGAGSFKNRISYKPTGDSTAFSRFVVCHNKKLATAMLIFVNSTGKPRIAPDNNRNGIPEDYNDKDIDSCLTDITVI